jgi:hypothetical protein
LANILAPLYQSEELNAMKRRLKLDMYIWIDRLGKKRVAFVGKNF